MSPAHPVFVVNPRAGGQRYAERWLACERRLAERLRRYEVVRTARAGDGTALARAALERGARLIVSCGGDGTHAEVARAFFDGLAPDAEGAPVCRFPDAAMGVLPLGTGNDLSRNLGLPRRALAAIDALGDPPRRIDVGWVALAGGERRLILNAASVGLSTAVLRSVDRLPRAFGGFAVYLGAGVASLATARRVPLSVRVDGGEARDVEPLLMGVCNGVSFGGGTRIAPLARVDDGRLEIVAIERGAVGALRLIHAFPTGRHIGRRGVSAWQGRTVELVARNAGEAVPVEVDGDLAGELPASFGVIPGGLRVAGAPEQPAVEVEESALVAAS